MKLLLIRPCILDDNFTSNFSHHAASFIKRKAQDEGWQVTDLGGKKANRANVEDSIKKENPDFIIHYDHGGPVGLMGNNKSESVLDALNANLLTSALISTVSCSSAFILGPVAVINSTRAKKAYLGHTLPIWVDTNGYLNSFIRAANAANLALLEGKNFCDAYKIGCDQYAKEIKKLQRLFQKNGDWVAELDAIGLWHNRNSFTLWGDGSAYAERP